MIVTLGRGKLDEGGRWFPREVAQGLISFLFQWTSVVAQMVKNLPANAGDVRCGFDLWVGKIPWKRARQHTPVFLPAESHEQRSLAGYSHKESDMIE